MAMRMTGMMSGMDTESIIQELVSAKRTKVDDVKKKQTKLEWKQDAWKELNTKLKNLQSKYVSNMRFSTAYMKKTTKVSNSSAVSVITGENAVNGVQSLQVKQLAKTGYLTGAKMKSANGSLTALSKLSDLTGGDSITGSGQIKIQAGSKEVNMNITADTTISDVMNQLKDAGLNANFDAKQQRLFVSAKESGEANDFSIVGLDSNGQAALSALGISTGVDATAKAEYQKWAAYVGTTDAETAENMKALYQDSIDKSVEGYLTSYKELTSNIESLKKDLDAATDDDSKAGIQKTIDEQQAKLDEIKKNIDVSESETTDSDGNKTTTYTATATETLTKSIVQPYVDRANYAKKVVDGTVTIPKSDGSSKIDGQDAIIYLNNAEFTNSTNSFEINGLTITALSETKAGEDVTITTEDDTDGIYDMIKNFFKEYNSIINEVDKLYNADSASGYEPLTDDEKEALSDSEVEKYEKKIKDALLRRDSNLSSIRTKFTSTMSAGVEVNGKRMYLNDFGIDTLGYFTAADNEKNAYHIDGDPDDDSTSGNADKLKSLISSDPDTVVSFFSALSRELYSTMDSLSSAVDGYRTYGSFYDDKKMKSDYADYTTKIAEMEEKVNDYEDKWYKKFSAMETALAKMQSNSSAISSLLGGS